jgi:Ion channel
MNTQPQAAYNAALALPLLVGAATTVLTIFIHGASGRAMVLAVLRSLRRGLAGSGFSSDVLVIAFAAMMLLTAHLIEVGVWASVLMLCGEFRGFGVACYHSAINYTTLGYGDIVMSPRWRVLGPLEALDGMLLVGISTAALFTVIQRIVRTSHPEVWEEINP